MKNEILKNSQLLNEAEINYFKDRYTQIRAQENEAETILRQNENSKEFIEQINSMSDYAGKRVEGKVSKGLSQFLDTKDQRDLLVSIWILSHNPAKAEKFGINPKEPKSFDKEVKIIINNTRRAAKELDKKSPSQEEVEEVISDREKTKEEEPQEEKPKEQPTQDDDETDEIDTDEPTQDDEESEEESDDEEKPERKGGSELVDTKDFKPPKEVAKDFESFKDERIKEVEDSFSAIKEPNREQQSRYDHAKSKIDKIFTNYKSKIMNKQRQYDVHPTRSSAMKASTAAQKMASDARREARDVVSKFKRSSMPGRLERAGMRARDIGRSVDKGVDAVMGSRAAKVTGDALKSAGKKGAELAKSGAAKAGEAAGKAIDRVKENMAARAIEKYLGAEKRNEYVENLRKGNTEEAEQIRQEGIAKAKEQREGKQATKRDERYDRMRTKQENFILRNYGKKLYELADNPVNREDEEETKEDPKIARTAVEIEKSIGANQAKEYMELSKSNDPKDLEDAAKILQNLENRKKESEKKLGIEEQNKTLRRSFRALYS